MSEYTVGLALGSVLVVLFDVYAYYRYRYSEEVLSNALRARKRAETARRFEEERIQREPEAAPGVSSIEFQRGFGEASGFTQLETIPVSFDELKRASGISSAEQEKELLKLRDELALLSEQLASFKKQAREKPSEEEDTSKAEEDKQVEQLDDGFNKSEDYGVDDVSFAERMEQTSQNQASQANQDELAEKRAKEREAFEAELNERVLASEPETESASDASELGKREHDTAGGLSESDFVKEDAEVVERVEGVEGERAGSQNLREIKSENESQESKPALSSLMQDLTAEEEPEEEFAEPTLKRVARAARTGRAARAVKRKTVKKTARKKR